MTIKRIVVFVLLVVIIGSCLFVNENLSKNTGAFDNINEAKVTFKYNEYSFTSELSNTEISSICNVFSNRRLYRDFLPACGFTKDISVCLNNSMTFCIATDCCPKIYWVEKRKYFRIPEKEKKQLHKILEKHGFFFPCV